jgi:hypothetical protein
MQLPKRNTYFVQETTVMRLSEFDPNKRDGRNRRRVVSDRRVSTQSGRSGDGLGFRATSYLTALERAPTLRYSNARVELPEPGLQQRIAKNPTCGRGSNPFTWRIMIWIDR